MGGNVFVNTKSIKIENIEPTVERYFQSLHKIFPKKKRVLNKKHFKYIGSVGKKPVSGDIDFAIDYSTIIDKEFSDEGIKQWGLNPEDIKNQFNIFKKRARTATDDEIMIRSLLKGIVDKINESNSNINADPKKITSGNIFSKYPQYNSDGIEFDYYVQIDWMVGNIEWLEFSYYSSVYENNVKGLHRTQLLLSMFQNRDLSFNHTKGVTDKQTGKVIATYPKSAIYILEDQYKIKLSKNTIKDYFKLIDIVNKLNKKDYDGIIDIYLKILDNTRADIPTDLQSEWIKRKSKLGLKGKFLPKDSVLLESI